MIQVFDPKNLRKVEQEDMSKRKKKWIKYTKHHLVVAIESYYINIKTKSGKNRFSEALDKTVRAKVSSHNLKYPNKKITVPTAKAVVRRGMGAYSTSHRPTISGGAPNSRTAWGLARLNKFMEKKVGKPVKRAYIQDDDLL